MRYRIKHITEYSYSGEVSHCFNLAHLLPRNTGRQHCLGSNISATPKASVTSRKLDYFGNHAFNFEIQRSHRKLTITAESEVHTSNQSVGSELDLGLGVTCLQVKDTMYNTVDGDTLTAREFTLPSVYAAPNEILAELSIRQKRPPSQRHWPKYYKRAAACAKTSPTCKSPVCGRWVLLRATCQVISKPCPRPGKKSSSAATPPMPGSPPMCPVKAG